MFIGSGAGSGALTLGRSGTSNNASFFLPCSFLSVLPVSVSPIKKILKYMFRTGTGTGNCCAVKSIHIWSGYFVCRLFLIVALHSGSTTLVLTLFLYCKIFLIWQVGPDIHLVYQGSFYRPDVLAEHRCRLFKDSAPELGTDTVTYADTATWLRTKKIWTFDSSCFG